MSITIGDAILYLKASDAGLKKTVQGVETTTKGAVERMASKFSLSTTAALGLVGSAVVMLGRQYLKNIDEGAALISSVDDISDRFGTTTKEAGTLANVMKTLGVSEGALSMAFKTLAGNDIPPTLAGLLQAKALLDATKNSSERTALTVKLLGRSGLEMAEMLRLDNAQLAGYIDRARNAAVVTDTMTDALDDHNRKLAEAKNRGAAANIIATQGGLITKNSLLLAWEESKARGAVVGALRTQGIETRGLNLSTEELLSLAGEALALEERGIEVRGRSAAEIRALTAANAEGTRTLKEWNDVAVAVTAANFQPISSGAVQAGRDMVRHLQDTKGSLDGIIAIVSGDAYNFTKPEDTERAAWLAQNGLPEIEANIRWVKDQAAAGLIGPEAAAASIESLETVKAGLLVLAGEPMDVVARALGKALGKPTRAARADIESTERTLRGLDGKHIILYIDRITTNYSRDGGARGYQHGGQFIVPGTGSGDRPVSVPLEPGELVTVTPKSQVTNYNFNLTAQYKHQTERSLRDDVRVLELLHG
jgi:hypothetical protein